MGPTIAELSRGGAPAPSTGSVSDAAEDDSRATDRAVDSTPSAVVDRDAVRTVDAAELREVLALTTRLAEPRPQPRLPTVPGSRSPVSRPFTGQGGDIDLDLMLDTLVENPFPGDEDFVVREPRTSERHVVLAVDISGSMRGHRVLAAAAAIAGLTAQTRTHVAVLAFWSDAAWLSHLDAPVGARTLVERLMRIPARGLTNVSFPLEMAAAEHRRARSPRPETILLSDCEHNAGPDPRLVASTAGRLSVLLDTTGPHDLELARQLVRGGGRLRTVATHRDVPRALADALRP